MAIDEAILILEAYKQRLVNSVTIGLDEDIEAYDMAIMALEYMHEDWEEYEEYCKRKESEAKNDNNNN